VDRQRVQEAGSIVVSVARSFPEGFERTDDHRTERRIRRDCPASRPLASSGTEIDASSTSVADIVCSIRRRAACAFEAGGEALNNATGLPGNASLAPCPVQCVLERPGNAACALGQEINQPSARPNPGTPAITKSGRSFPGRGGSAAAGPLRLQSGTNNREIRWFSQ